MLLSKEITEFHLSNITNEATKITVQKVKFSIKDFFSKFDEIFKVKLLLLIYLFIFLFIHLFILQGTLQLL